MPTVAAIIPTFNRSHMLRECIDSILAQSQPVQEIIVVDDGSTDNTKEVIAGYGDRVHSISKPNGGKSSALNLALANCAADYIWICDDDDYASPGAVRHLTAILDADSSLGFVFGTYRTFRDRPGERAFAEPAYWARAEEPNPFINFAEGMFTFQFAMMVRKTAYDQVGQFREDLIRSQDYDMTLRLAHRFKSAFVPEVIFYQRQHAGQRGNAGGSFGANASELKWLKYDHDIFSRLRHEVPLDRFTPTFALGWRPELAERASLLQRACVMAKRALWSEAVADLHRAASIGAGKPSDEEVLLAEAVVRTYPTWNLLRKEIGLIRTLHALYSSTAFGRGVVFAVCRPLVWQARALLAQGRRPAAIQRLLLMASILGISGAFERLFRSFTARA